MGLIDVCQNCRLQGRVHNIVHKQRNEYVFRLRHLLRHWIHVSRTRTTRRRCRSVR